MLLLLVLSCRGMLQRWMTVTYLMLMLLLCCFALPGLCPPNSVPVAVGITWLLRFGLLPLTDSLLCVFLSNVACHAANRLALEERFENLRVENVVSAEGGRVWQHLARILGDRMEDFEEGLKTWMSLYTSSTILYDVSVIFACCIVCFCLHQGLLLNVKQGIEAANLRSEGKACSALLGTICDAHFFLDADLRLEHDEPGLASMLFHLKTNQGTNFDQCLASEEDKTHFVEMIEKSNADDTFARAMHAHVRDGVGNIIPMEIFHVRTSDALGEVKHLVGIREYGDEKLLDARSAVPEPEQQIAIPGYHSLAHTDSGSSDGSRSERSSRSSESSTDKDYILFDANGMQVFSASKRIMKKLELQTVDCSFLDMVSTADRAQVGHQLADAVDSLSLESEAASTLKVDLCFSLKSAKSSRVRIWNCELQKQHQEVVGYAQLIGRLRKNRSIGSGRGTLPPLPEKARRKRTIKL
ncbi:unnamed protein product [Effrenium voratum]|nr:unnamed protein product [Effrenium voratum]CAJ1429261.1 unnamed protein product [Effrenium voratum]